MSGEQESPNVYEDLQTAENHQKHTVKEPWKRWFVIAAVVAGVLLAVVCLGAGFAIGYFAVPCQGWYN